MRDARACRRCGEPRRRLAVDLIVAFRGDAAYGVRDAGKMDDVVDAVEKRPPIERLHQIGMLDHFDAVGKRKWQLPPHRGTDA